MFFVEEPFFDAAIPTTEVRPGPANLSIVVPHLPPSVANVPDEAEAMQRSLLDRFLLDAGLHDPILWYYTPMALGFTSHLGAPAIVYDCMDELSGFLGAPPALRERERNLFRRADLVFTGGPSLFAAKRDQHPSVHLFPSSVDVAHFARARRSMADPVDQAAIPYPRIGFFGVIDERLDRDLVRGLAEARPEWQVVLVGPVVKIDQADLPIRANIHYLGPKSYAELPDYLAGWDVTVLPFARNEATRFISPTKTPEYLAAGKPVVSTRIQDVVDLYGRGGLVHFGDTVDEFVAAIEAARAGTQADRLPRIDACLANLSWDRTWEAQWRLIEGVIAGRKTAADTLATSGATPVAASGRK